jgi:hypothetical protein
MHLNKQAPLHVACTFLILEPKAQVTQLLPVLQQLQDFLAKAQVNALRVAQLSAFWARRRPVAGQATAAAAARML